MIEYGDHELFVDLFMADEQADEQGLDNRIQKSAHFGARRQLALLDRIAHNGAHLRVARLLSVVTTVLMRRQQFHLARLSEHLSPGSPALTMTFQALALRMHGAGGAGGQPMGLALILQYLMGKAAGLSFIDTYVVLGVGSGAMFFLSFLLKSNDPKSTEQPMGH
jgi:hypothetical protein